MFSRSSIIPLEGRISNKKYHWFSLSISFSISAVHAVQLGLSTCDIICKSFLVFLATL